ncbi:hypothetical protein [Sphingomonas sp. OTU376]
MQRKNARNARLIALGAVSTRTKGTEPDGQQDTVGLKFIPGISTQD